MAVGRKLTEQTAGMPRCRRVLYGKLNLARFTRAARSWPRYPLSERSITRKLRQAAGRRQAGGRLVGGLGWMEFLSGAASEGEHLGPAGAAWECET